MERGKTSGAELQVPFQEGIQAIAPVSLPRTDVILHVSHISPPRIVTHPSDYSEKSRSMKIAREFGPAVLTIYETLCVNGVPLDALKAAVRQGMVQVRIKQGSYARTQVSLTEEGVDRFFMSYLRVVDLIMYTDEGKQVMMHETNGRTDISLEPSPFVKIEGIKLQGFEKRTKQWLWENKRNFRPNDIHELDKSVFAGNTEQRLSTIKRLRRKFEPKGVTILPVSYTGTPTHYVLTFHQSPHQKK